MFERDISCFDDLHQVLDRYRCGFHWVFRGHSSVKWGLVPKVGRNEIFSKNERSMFVSWKRRAVEHVLHQQLTDWDWLSIAQHHGLATRFLDWSVNPLVAAFFAVESQSEEDAVIYAFKPKKFIKNDVRRITPDPLDYRGQVALFKPSAFAHRISRQGGYFTIHNPNTRELSDGHGSLEKIIIKKDYRPRLVQELNHYGFNRYTIYSDLDNLSSYVNWTVSMNEFRQDLYGKKPESEALDPEDFFAFSDLNELIGDSKPDHE